MRKNNNYTSELKLQIIKEYLNGNLSYDSIAKKYNIRSSTQIKLWVKQYQEFGKDYFKIEKHGRPKKKKELDINKMSIEEQLHYYKMENDI